MSEQYCRVRDFLAPKFGVFPGLALFQTPASDVTLDGQLLMEAVGSMVIRSISISKEIDML